MCGQNPKWVKWHYDNMFKNSASSGFLYTQIGQENSFQWTEELEKAINFQYELADNGKDEYGFEYITFAEMGQRFKRRYAHTPDTCVYALDDWAEKGNKSVWFNNSRYRINIFSDSRRVWIRDLQLFDESHRDVYLDEPCAVAMGVYDNLPITDGVRFSDGLIQGGIFFGAGSIKSVEKIDGKAVIKIMANNKEISIYLTKDKIIFEAEIDFGADFAFKDNCEFIKAVSNDNIKFVHNTGTEYCLYIKEGSINGKKMCSSNGRLVFGF